MRSWGGRRNQGSAGVGMTAFNHSVTVLGVQRQQQAAGAEWVRMAQRLSTGLRVNAARDDAAGLAQSSRLTVNVRAATTLSRGVMDGISLVQVADGGLNQIQQALQRARELAVQAANGVLTDRDRAALDAEYRQLLRHIDQVAGSTAAFDTHLLAREASSVKAYGQTPSLLDIFGATSGNTVTLASGIKPVAYIPPGALNVRIDITSYGADDDIQLFSQDGTHLVGTPLTDHVWAANAVNTDAELTTKAMALGNGFSQSASYVGPPAVSGDGAYDPVASPLSVSVNGMTIGYSGDGDYQDSGVNNGLVDSAYQRESVQVDVATEPLMVMVVGSGIFTATASWDHMPSQVVVPPAPPGRGPVDVVVQADHGGSVDSLRIEQMPADAVSLGVSVTTLSSADGARAAMDGLSTALDRISGYRAELGALSARFDSVIDHLATAKETQSAAQGRIVDADMADVSAQLARANILASAGQALLTQANTALRTSVLQLLGTDGG